MKKRKIDADGIPVVIRPMDKDHVIDFCGPGRAKGRSDPAFQQFHRELMERYRNSAIVAWSQGKIVGFVNFSPANVVTSFPLCPEHVPANPQVDWSSESSKTLGVGLEISKGIGQLRQVVSIGGDLHRPPRFAKILQENSVVCLIAPLLDWKFLALAVSTSIKLYVGKVSGKPSSKY